MLKNERSGAGRFLRSFSSKFKTDAVSLVLDKDLTVADMASSIGINEGTLGHWICQAYKNLGDEEGVTTSEELSLLIFVVMCDLVMGHGLF